MWHDIGCSRNCMPQPRRIGSLLPYLGANKFLTNFGAAIRQPVRVPDVPVSRPVPGRRRCRNRHRHVCENFLGALDLQLQFLIGQHAIVAGNVMPLPRMDGRIVNIELDSLPRQVPAPGMRRDADAPRGCLYTAIGIMGLALRGGLTPASRPVNARPFSSAVARPEMCSGEKSGPPEESRSSLSRGVP